MLSHLDRAFVSNAFCTNEPTRAGKAIASPNPITICVTKKLSTAQALVNCALRFYETSLRRI